jgi:hypothetical protein
MRKRSVLRPASTTANASLIRPPLEARLILRPQHLCETRNGDLAFSLGRMRFRNGRPMLVEHLDGLFLEHALCGRVLTSGYGDEFDIMHVFAEEGAGL